MGVDVLAHIGFGIAWAEDEVNSSQLDEDLCEENSNGNLKTVTNSWYGSDQYRSPVLVVVESFESVEWESSVIDHLFPINTQENRERWSKELKIACARLGLEYKDPHWLLWTRMW